MNVVVAPNTPYGTSNCPAHRLRYRAAPHPGAAGLAVGDQDGVAVPGSDGSGCVPHVEHEGGAADVGPVKVVRGDAECVRHLDRLRRKPLRRCP